MFCLSCSAMRELFITVIFMFVFLLSNEMSFSIDNFSMLVALLYA